ncbi:BTAD domain-containing putative transcriptional regulator [Pseudonocardia nematodicida]|uniref:BTAD domain-containing putative transcriptional regulator n=1 Tax=Pseudonocardia nematodicida TaxID=1206997 RepID=A0ABV1KGU5_9PSEU
MGDVSMRVLGPLHVTAGGAAVPIGSGRQRELLARLAVAGGDVVAVDALVDDLWHGEPPPRAHGGLQVHVSRLRRLLEPGRSPRAAATVLVSRPPGYALSLDPGALDADAFTTLVDRAVTAEPGDADVLLGRALALWSGPAYAEFADADWARAEAGRLDELGRVAVERRGRARLLAGRADAVVPDLEALLGAHPLREDAVALLAVALYRTGRQADALAVLARTRRQLGDELGIDPGPRLRETEAAVLAHRDPGPEAGLTTGPGPGTPGAVGSGGTGRDLGAAAPSGPVPADPSRPAGLVEATTGAAAPEHGLLGRTAELARLTAAAASARRGAQLVLVAGDAGAGKSALLAAFATDFASDGWTAVTGRCPGIDGAPPGWAWREAVDALLATHPATGDLLERLAPLRSPTGPAGAGETFWLARAVIELLASPGRERPVLLVLDDLHRAETETLALLRSVVTGLAGSPVLVVAALRPGEVSAELEAALAALAEPTVDRIEPGPLTGPEVAGLLARHGVAEPDAGTVSQVADRTGGNPLFVRELARLVASEGSAAAAEAVPAGVRDVLRRRLARLPAGTRTALARVAVLGRDVDTDDALDLVGTPDGPDPLDALEPAVLGGMLVEPGPGRLRFSHALVRDTLYADLPQLHRGRLHAAALEILGRRRPDDPVPLAHHALAAGPAVEPARALDLATDAARATAAFGAHREAARLLGRAVDLAGPAGAGPGAELSLRCGRVTELARSGDGTAAVRERGVAVDRALAVAPDRVGDALTSYDALVSWTIRPGQHLDPRMVALLEAELARTPADDVARRVRLLAALVFEVEGQDDDRTRSASTEAVRLTTGDDADPLLRCRALNARFFAVLGPDLWHEMAGVGAELRDLGGRIGHAGYRSQGHHLLFMVAAADGDLDGAQREVDAAVATAPGGGLAATLGWAAIFAAVRALVAGDLDLAERRYAEVTARLDRGGDVNSALIGTVGRFAVRHAQGRLGEIAGEFDAMVPLLPPAFGDFAALTHLRAGDADRARAVWRPDVPLARSYYWLPWTCVRAEVAVGLGDRDVAAACRDELAPWSGTIAGLSSGTIALGPTDLVLAELAGMLDGPGAAREHHLRVAADVADRLGAGHWVARARPGERAQPPNTSVQRRR